VRRRPAVRFPAAESPRALPDGVAVRRSTGPGLITLRPSYGVDLDDVTEPSWDVGIGCCDRDVRFGSNGRRLSIDGGHAVVTGPLGFATCFHETAYTDEAIERGSLRPGDTMCVRTNGHRFVLVTIVDVSEQGRRVRGDRVGPAGPLVSRRSDREASRIEQCSHERRGAGAG
jgi:hypothetical protein